MNTTSNRTASTPAASVGTHPEGTRTGEPARAWIGVPPLPYRNDEPSPAHWFWIELGPRIRRRPRCDGEG